jgi:predicted secreted protein
MKLLRLLGNRLVLAVLLPLPVFAGDADTRDRAEINAAVDGVAPNDTLRATLAYEAEGNDSALLADEVNKAMADAIQRTKQQPDIKLETSSYQTLPVYQKEKRSGWRVRQSLQLEGHDPKVFSALLGQLQTTLHLESEQHITSPEKVREVQDALITKAIQAFRARAEVVTHAFGYKSYRVVSVAINTPGDGGRPFLMAAPAPRAMMARDAAVAAPVIEAGEERIQISVNGSIEMD